jgi:hypothetical protein
MKMCGPSANLRRVTSQKAVIWLVKGVRAPNLSKHLVVILGSEHLAPGVSLTQVPIHSRRAQTQSRNACTSGGAYRL